VIRSNGIELMPSLERLGTEARCRDDFVRMNGFEKPASDEVVFPNGDAEDVQTS